MKHKIKRLVVAGCLCFASAGSAIEEQPWFGDVYEFHFLGSYSYSWFNSVQNSEPPFHQFFQSNLIYGGLDFSPAPVWNIDADIQFADTSAVDFSFRTSALQARYLWLDDIIGDPISFTTGASMRLTSTNSLTDVSCPSHGNMDFEINAALGKELDALDTWRFRAWVFGALGHANRGSPWVRGTAALEMNVHDIHKWALYADGINGYGGRTHIDVERFSGYAKVREKAIDLGIRYGYGIGVWGTLRVNYIRRVLAKTAPKNVNTLVLSYLLPFSF
ncbi:MAG: hypothetical protein HY861_01645 [Chlamydiia bacterium]|nr:hypothetical protein [Chlamydiia bacterium]